MQTPATKIGRAGFTLVEILVVIGIIAVIASMLIPAVARARRKAGETSCISAQRQLAMGLIMYRDEHNDTLPLWLSNLYPNYIDAKEAFLCRADKSMGAEGGKPDGVTEVNDQFSETDDTASNNIASRNRQIDACSYLYEFNGAPCSWPWSSYLGATAEDVDRDGNTGITTWNEVKHYQLQHGDSSAGSGGKPYISTSFPMVRCFHHWYVRKVPAYIFSSTGTGAVVGRKEDYLTINIAYEGNVFYAPLEWEALIPGG